MPSFVWAIRFWLIQTRPVAEFRWLGVCEYAMMPRRRIFWGIFRLLLRVTSPWWLAVACDQLRMLRYCLLLNGTHTAQDTLWYVSVLRYRVSLDINTISGFLLPSIHPVVPFLLVSINIAQHSHNVPIPSGTNTVPWWTSVVNPVHPPDCLWSKKSAKLNPHPIVFQYGSRVSETIPDQCLKRNNHYLELSMRVIVPSWNTEQVSVMGLESSLV